MNSYQQDARRNLIELFEQDELLDPTAWPNSSILTAYKDAFSDFFFSGAGKPFVRLKVETNRSVGNLGDTVADPERGAPYVLIRIFNPRARGRSLIKRRAVILQVLLHELLHSLFQVYLCRGLGCNTELARYNTDGLEGHGPSWVYLAFKLQETVLRWPFLVGILQPRGFLVPLLIVDHADIESANRSAVEHGYRRRFYPRLFPYGI